MYIEPVNKVVTTRLNSLAKLYIVGLVHVRLFLKQHYHRCKWFVILYNWAIHVSMGSVGPYV